MDLSPTDAALRSIDRIDLYNADPQYDFRLADILRRRQRPLLLLLNRDAELLYSSAPLAAGDDGGEVPDPRVDAALAEAQRLFREPQPVVSLVKQLVVDKPGERCALVILENRFHCMRLFRLQKVDQDAEEVYAALIEPIGNTKLVDLDKVKGLFRLSRREVDVLDALMSGMTDKEIAARLTVSVETVRAYLKSIRAKLGVKTRTAIVSTVHNLRSGIPDLGRSRD
ncbi:MAG TPA: helix-turn-helix transcriptional regulator [Gammaproteobacteria bacterium]